MLYVLALVAELEKKPYTKNHLLQSGISTTNTTTAISLKVKKIMVWIVLHTSTQSYTEPLIKTPIATSGKYVLLCLEGKHVCKFYMLEH